MDAEEADDGEVAEHAVQGFGAVFAGEGGGVLVAFLRCDLFVDLGALDERVQDVEDGVAAPDVGVFSEDLRFFFVGGGSGDSIAVSAEGFELVDKLVNDIPGPVVIGGFDVDGPVGVEDVVEETAVVVVTVEFCFECSLIL